MFSTYTEDDIKHTKNQSKSNIVETPENELIARYELDKCVKWIEGNNYQRTCLQFPEHLLNDGTSIGIYLQKVLGRTVYILADTSYGSCCVDEVAAEHVNGDSIIHFGHACLSPVIKLPVLYIFEKEELNLKNLHEKFKIFSEDTHIVVFYSDVYYHLYPDLINLFKDRANIHVSRLNINNNDISNDDKIICSRIFSKNESQVSAVYLGGDCVTLQNLVLGLPDFKWFQYSSEELLEYKMNLNKFLMQRSHLIEKIREANVVGILIGTLGIKNYLDAVDRIKLLVKHSGKKCYILAVGKPNVAKLANFPEIDMFVCIACQENALLKDFKDYYKPVVSLFEIEMALADRPYSVKYTSDFRELLPGGTFYIKSEPDSNTSNPIETCQELAEKHPGTIVESAGAQFLSNRTWRGLEQNLEETEVHKAVKGRTGIPQAYENELTTLSDDNHFH